MYIYSAAYFTFGGRPLFVTFVLFLMFPFVACVRAAFILCEQVNSRKSDKTAAAKNKR